MSWKKLTLAIVTVAATLSIVLYVAEEGTKIEALAQRLLDATIIGSISGALLAGLVLMLGRFFEAVRPTTGSDDSSQNALDDAYQLMSPEEEVEGPVSFEEIVKRWREGRLDNTWYLRQFAEGKWEPIAKYRDLL